MNRDFALFVLALAAGAASGCSPKAGRNCSTEGREHCTDVHHALVCVAGRWKEVPCKGPQGCAGAGEKSHCDDAVADAQEACGAESDVACSSDRRAYLTCANHTWTLAGSCRGPKACTVGANEVTCDSTLARLDDACNRAGNHACSEDQKSVLVCTAGKFVLASRCLGPKACSIAGDQVSCDDSLGEVGDPCEGDHYACAVDGRAVLQCKAARLAHDEACGKRQACKVQGNKVGCM
jgi:hypothetical protein